MRKNKDLCLCALMTALIAAGAFIKIPTPLLPITCQTLFTSLSGLILGKKRAAISVFVYIFLGLIGLPVFAEGGGISYILKPSFGYLLGFLLGAFITGKLSENKSTFKSFLLSSLSGLAIIYIIGIIYFYLISRFYLENQIEARILLINCFLLTLPGDVLMCILSSSIAKRLKSALKYK